MLLRILANFSPNVIEEGEKVIRNVKRAIVFILFFVIIEEIIFCQFVIVDVFWFFDNGRLRIVGLLQLFSFLLFLDGLVEQWSKQLAEFVGKKEV